MGKARPGVTVTSEPPTRRACSGPMTGISRITGGIEKRWQAQINDISISARPWTRPLYPPTPKPLPDDATAGGVLYNRDSRAGKGLFPRRSAYGIAAAGPYSRYAHLGSDPPPPFPPRAAPARRHLERGVEGGGPSLPPRAASAPLYRQARAYKRTRRLSAPRPPPSRGKRAPSRARERGVAAKPAPLFPLPAPLQASGRPQTDARAPCLAS